MAETRTYKQAVEYFKHPPLDASGYVSDDIGWSDRMMLDHILDVRSAEVKKADRLKEPIDSFNIQTLSCIELEEADPVDCPCAPPSGCFWQKSKTALPRMLYKVSLTTINGRDSIGYVDWTDIENKTKSRIKSNRKKRYYTTRDSGDGTFLYILNDDFLKAVALSAVFEDPYCAAAFPKCGEDNTEVICNPWDADIKTDRSMFDRIMRIAWSTLMPVRSGAAFDWSNDSTDNPKGYVQPKI